MTEGVGKARFPLALKPLFEPARYKILYGGRGGGKSWGIAMYLLIEAARAPLRVLCCREVQTSIRESVHKLLSELIESLRLADRFTVLEREIRGINGSEFLFEGLRHNIGSIRSIEGIDKVWVEEAVNVSRASWEVLIPTIRKDGSEIIVSFNPELDTDETYRRFVVAPPSDATIIKVNYHQNPWFPPVLRREMEDLQQRDPDAYQHIYLGECRYTLDGAIYARELREAQEEGRICPVPYDPTKPVNVYFDLGWADSTAVWFVQHIGGQVRLIDYEEDRQQTFGDYLRRLQAKGYTYQTMWLPHDAQAKALGTGRSIEEMARAAGWRVRIVPRLSVADGINAARTLFATMWFDQARCADGVQALRHYRYDVDSTTGAFSRNPLHDQASHGCLTADAVILTERGSLPIVDVAVGDRVWTPCGYSSVTHAGPVKQVSKLVEIVLADGRSIRCTPEHKLLTNRGFVCADALRYSDRVFGGNEWPIRLLALYSKARHIGFRAAITGEMSGAQKVRRTFIGRFGSTITGLFQTVGRSITRTVIRSIMPWATSSAWTPANTNANICGSVGLLENSAIRVNLHAGVQPSGTLARKDWRGIDNLPSNPGTAKFGTNASVSSVASRFVRLFLHGPSTAISIARWKTCDSGEEWQWVYDLTCENHACYQANGLLVSNSDALRYCAVAMQESARASYLMRDRAPRLETLTSRGQTGWLGI